MADLLRESLADLLGREVDGPAGVLAHESGDALLAFFLPRIVGAFEATGGEQPEFVE